MPNTGSCTPAERRFLDAIKGVIDMLTEDGSLGATRVEWLNWPAGGGDHA